VYEAPSPCPGEPAGRPLRSDPECGWIAHVDDNGLGMKFWGGLIGGVIILGVALFVFFLVINRAFYAWGALGTFIVLGGILLLIAWFYDRRQVRRYEEE
jgi:uncharacterized membrane protein HdeD (DUF308 family)